MTKVFLMNTTFPPNINLPFCKLCYYDILYYVCWNHLYICSQSINLSSIDEKKSFRKLNPHPIFQHFLTLHEPTIIKSYCLHTPFTKVFSFSDISSEENFPKTQVKYYPPNFSTFRTSLWFFSSLEIHFYCCRLHL